MRKPVVHGMVALNSFPLFKQTLLALCTLCDKVHIRFDAVNGDPEHFRRLPEICGKKLGTVMTIADGKWQVPVWREECLRLLDEDKPDIVLCPDEDEIFGEGFVQELGEFWRSGKKAIMFSYDPLVTNDGRVVNDNMPYPPDPHMKAFKWEPELTYWPYHSNAIIAKYVNPDCHWEARTKIRHYCAFTKRLQELKHWRSDTPIKRGNKVVTILGFGPTIDSGIELAGEVWSLNLCYEVFPVHIMRMVSRIFDMHKFGPRQGGYWDKVAEHINLPELQNRNQLKAKNGKLHVANLDELGKLGHRIIMQESHPDVYNSEAYPITQIVTKLGLDMFSGTSAYMIAMAILEGFTEIRLFGFDQMDWEHEIQRESHIAWCAYAVARKIRVSGKLVFMERFKRRYGYDHGPEWGPDENKLLWMSHPIEIKYKGLTRMMAGKPFGHVPEIKNVRAPKQI